MYLQKNTKALHQVFFSYLGLFDVNPDTGPDSFLHVGQDLISFIPDQEVGRQRDDLGQGQLRQRDLQPKLKTN